jgi:hypothetical protein
VKVIAVLAFLLAAAALTATGYGLTLLREQRAQIADLQKKVDDVAPTVEKFKGSVRDMGRDLAALVMDEIDLNKTGWQPIGRGFFVIDIGSERTTDGLQVRGKVINTSALTHESLLFRVRVGAASAPFTLSKAAPGVALPFEVVVSDVPPAALQKGFVTLESSTISFASTSAKSQASKEPIDTDRLLR